MNVERMNSILFEDSTIVRSSQSGATTYNNNTGVANYDDNSEMYHYKTYLKMRKAQAIWKKPFQEHLNLSTAMVDFNEDYRLFSTDNKTGKLTYQRFLNGYPTFNNQNLNEIQVTWGKRRLRLPTLIT